MAHGRPAKRRRLTPPVDVSIASETIKSSDLFHRAADWDLEQDYERKSRHKKSKETTRLPIKTADGRVEQVKEREVSEDEVDSLTGSGSEGEDGHQTPPTDEVEETPRIPLPPRQQITAAKEELARLAGLINEDPEEHTGSFKKLAQIGESHSHPTIQALALATQAAVYKDVIPGYRIRAYKEEELGVKVSKDVRRMRQYEQALVNGYQSYVKQLRSIAKSIPPDDKNENGLRSVAINCACTLLLSVPHFNFRTELLNLVVHDLSKRQLSRDFRKCLETLEAFFIADEDGAPSLEAVSILTKMMKAKDYRIREEVLNTFLQLRLLSELPAHRSTATPGKQDGTGISKLHGRKIKKEKWEHRSKTERKLARERKAVEKDMKEADATVSHEERERMQSETLKLVFITYFRILKAKIPELMGAVLEGLAKYAHLINQDFFGDVLEALKDIVNQARAADDGDDNGENDSLVENPDHESDDHQQILIRNRTRESLLSTQTAFTLLSGQDVSKSASALHLDLSFFTSNIYRSLYPLSLDPDIELGPKSLRLPDPHASSSSSPSSANSFKVNISTPILLLTRVLTSILLTPSQPPPTITAASFYKRLLTASLHLPEKSLLAILDLVGKITDNNKSHNKHGLARKIEPLWYSDERKGDGVFDGSSTSIEATNVFAVGSGVWEIELLRRHYCPRVRDGVLAMHKAAASAAAAVASR